VAFVRRVVRPREVVLEWLNSLLGD
jgi:hypothetical protein